MIEGYGDHVVDQMHRYEDQCYEELNDWHDMVDREEEMFEAKRAVIDQEEE